ncbi:MAG: methanogenesis marker 8 protein [Halobacteriota archaeon]|nr:methanogenesis marker 8 protein [Halobacteriota archaeon]
MSEHIFELNGKVVAVVRDGSVTEIKGPLKLEYCPLQHSIRGVEKITKDTIKESIEGRIKAFGMCTEDRIIEIKPDFVDFGTSEIMACAMESDMIDAAVEPCDGAGTVIAIDPRIVQGIGGIMSGLVKTTPIPKLIDRLEKRGSIVIDPKGAKIDQKEGLKVAFDRGYKDVSVTVSKLEEAKVCREIEEEVDGRAVLFGVHTSGMSENEVKEFVDLIDVTTSCASKKIREVADKALVQVGNGIPVYAFSETGKDIVLNRISYMKSQVLIKTCELPELPEARQPRPLL